MNLKLQGSNQVSFYTDLNLVFKALGDICESFDWFVSDIEMNIEIDHDFDCHDKWITGEKLNHILKKYEIQFIWGVFSAFEKGERLDIKNAPYMYDNPRYWNGLPVMPQLDKAQLEIACWDSSATFLIGLDEKMANNFRSIYSGVIEIP